MTNSTIRAVIVDDEPLARERLRTLLHEDPAVEIAAEAGDRQRPSPRSDARGPTWCFSTCRCPGATGFDVIDARRARSRCRCVVFVTAYDQYALRAFEVHALDYLLKPFDRDRFRSALARARQQLARATPGDLEQPAHGAGQRSAIRPPHG